MPLLLLLQGILEPLNDISSLLLPNVLHSTVPGVLVQNITAANYFFVRFILAVNPHCWLTHLVDWHRTSYQGWHSFPFSHTLAGLCALYYILLYSRQILKLQKALWLLQSLSPNYKAAAVCLRMWALKHIVSGLPTFKGFPIVPLLPYDEYTELRFY